MPSTIQRKLTDSNDVVARGGRAESYWLGKLPKKSLRYQVDGSPEVVDQFEIIKKYNLKGFEYGNWVNNNDRNDRLTATAESLNDLSLLMGSNNIGLDGLVGIAFGARGHSKALAHFEPDTFMINLTREKGFGSLAHEYGHALDYFFGMYVDQHRDYASLVGGRTTTQLMEFPNSGQLRQRANKMINAVIFKSKGKKSATYLEWENKLAGSDYWFRRNEIFARLFEQWVRAKLRTWGIRNTFLSKEKYEHFVYIKPADFARVEPMMDRLVNDFSRLMNGKKKSTGIKLKASFKKAAKK